VTGKKLTAELLAEVERLLREGGTASSIGAAVGRSRNSIVGLVHRHLKHVGFRLAAPKMVEIVRKRRVLEAKRALLRERARMGSDREAIPAQPPEPPTQPLLWELREHHCRWPLWAAEVDDINEKRFCGAGISRGRYCAHHADRAYAVSVRRR
jgi:hypothetical protein